MVVYPRIVIILAVILASCVPAGAAVTLTASPLSLCRKSAHHGLEDQPICANQK